MQTEKYITESLKDGTLSVYEVRGSGGRKLLTLSYRPGKGFRYYIGPKPRGGGRKHTPCSESQAWELINRTIA